MAKGKGRWEWWITNLLHIETLFMIGLVITLIYLLFFTKGKVDTKGYEKLIFMNGTYTPPSSSTQSGKSKPKKEKQGHQHEERCREIFQDIFGKKFKSIRPDWLENPVSGQNLELDGFCPSIPTRLGTGLAFEYDGEQHSKYKKHFHRGGPKEFIYQTKKDAWKDLVCKERGILLIRIPWFVPYQDLDRYIKQRLRKEGLGSYLGLEGAIGDGDSGFYD
jgi:hypothetical protein